MLGQILPAARIWALTDRDDKSDEEVAELEASGTITLSRRNLESFLFADDVIESLVALKGEQLPAHEGEPSQIEAAQAIKRSALSSSVSRGNPPDDLKSAAGEIYVGLKNLLGLTQRGNTKDAFMRDTLAPLIAPGMGSYQELKAAIIDRVS